MLGMEDVNSHLVQAYLKAGDGKMNFHPAKTHRSLFYYGTAEAVVTYRWKLGLGGRKGLLTMIKESGFRPETTVWIDIWFIDQNSKNVVTELAIAQEYYMRCMLHLIAVDESELDDDSDIMDRGWCLWELGLRAHSKRKSHIMGMLKRRVRL